MEGAKFVPWLGSPRSSISQHPACGSSPDPGLGFIWRSSKAAITDESWPLVVSVAFGPSVLFGSIDEMLRLGGESFIHTPKTLPPLWRLVGVQQLWSRGQVLGLSQHHIPISWMGTVRPEEISVHPPEPPTPQGCCCPQSPSSGSCWLTSTVLFFSWVRVGFWAGQFVLGREPAYSPWEQRSPVSSGQTVP